MVKDGMSIPHSRRARKGAAKKKYTRRTRLPKRRFPLFYWARRISARSPTQECMPSASFDDKKISDFLGRVSRRVGRAWGGRMGWTHEVGESGRHAPRAARVLRAPGRCGANVGARADATRRGRRGYFARRAVVGPTWEARADVPRRGWRGYIARQVSVHVREL